MATPELANDVPYLGRCRESAEQRRDETDQEEAEQIREAIRNEALPGKASARRTPENTLTNHRYGEGKPDKDDVEVHGIGWAAIDDGVQCHKPDEE